MKNFKMGTAGMGIFLGIVLAGSAALIMAIGFWRAILLIALFGIGFFVGTMEVKGNILKNVVNRLVPGKKEATVINYRAEIEKEQAEVRKTVE